MDRQLLILATILTVFDSHTKVIATPVTFESSPTSFLRSASTSSSNERIQLFWRLSDNSGSLPTSTPVPTDADRARALKPLVDFMVVLTRFAVVAIILGEGRQIWQRRALRRITQAPENEQATEDREVDD